MRQSKFFTKAVKELPKDETSFNAKELIRAGFVDKVAAGIYSFLPLGLKVHEKICQIVREEMDAIGGQEISMPTLIPKESWETTGRWKSFDVLFRLAGADKKEYGLGATHEEVITPLMKKFISSYKDLPAAPYQIKTKFRNELRAKAGLIRGREFSMKDMYSFHKDQKDLDDFYEVAIEAYFKIYKRLGLEKITYLTYASGGSFSKYSHEFQTLTEAGEDIIYICEKCRVAINKEIISEQKSCPKCGNKNLIEKKAVEVGNIFKLGNRFSKPFGLVYMDEKGEKQDVVMGCYGIGPSRLMGTIVEMNHDERGIVWPEEIAPFKVHFIEMKSKEAKVRQEAEKLYNDLTKKGVEVLYDDRENVSAGEKFAEADLIGCPYRLVISEKTLAENCVELKKRSDKELKMVKISEIKF
ncbi:MAG: aminoacyl--tRNA ligase-related protein [Patescibacteria group bacterium]